MGFTKITMNITALMCFMLRTHHRVC